MTEARSPRERQALALLDNTRFAEWLDATAAHGSGWPHNATTGRAWLCEQCGIESLGRLAVCPAGAKAFDEIERRFALWASNQELGL
ncbi:hypothetical protein F0A17_01825 [Billgrantia pellis]|uniref:Uncharacterized protein n=1 Tax=Billgrantia pellis TaxID=2606936 RepID=A0A7V7G2K4_9GAMM|nr:hypothetical protein [Halomonas pellis]KAA0014413.1 hypothetical protein F0A17_01825 [Halomonas pellis]